MLGQRFFILLFYVYGVSLASNLTCNTASNCTKLADNLQITGTQESFTESTVVLHDALNRFGDDYSLWSSHGKLNLFYTLNWQLAKESIDKSLLLDKSANNLNSYLFAGWLHSTMQFRDISDAEAYFQSGIDLISSSNNPSNFWPYFEYAVFLSHIAEDFEESQRMFEFAVNASSLDNPFIAFFYGLLVEYHLDDTDLDGEQLIQSAMQTAKDGYLPGQAAWNMVFQGILLESMNRTKEAKRCCEFSAAILSKNVSNWYVFCPNIIDDDDVNHDLDLEGGDESKATSSFGIDKVWIGLVLGMLVIR
mmetsp:Transcript_35107/g.48974  ORF Transcript_35107/g.48974 Transcript_35107/m.48974 type:complete len:306 (+) Transcript_35107:98-1015(+)